MEKSSYLADAAQLFGEKWKKEMIEEVRKQYEVKTPSEMVEELKKQLDSERKANIELLGKLNETQRKLDYVHEETRAELREAHEQCQIMRAQLDMVHLIFGNR